MDYYVKMGQPLGWGQTEYNKALMDIIGTERSALKSGDRILNKTHRPFATDGGRELPKLIDPTDHDNTEFLYTPKSLGGAVRGAKKLRFLDMDIGGIARNQLFSSLKIVSPSLVQAFKQARVTGVQFIEDKDYF